MYNAGMLENSNMIWLVIAPSFPCYYRGVSIISFDFSMSLRIISFLQLVQARV